MQENEFEKQVRHKMDEFRVHPSDPVWLGIREELRRKKGDVFFLFRFLLCCWWQVILDATCF